MASTQTKTTPIVLTIAGSDSGGGAGIQADIKAISATGSYACSVLTALTAQNTQGVTSIFPVTPEFVEQQLDAVFTDLNVVAVKVGMLSDSSVIKAVANKIRQYQPKHLVVDPVMVATSGDLLLEHSAIDTLKSELIPLADVITPNLPEAAALLGTDVPASEQQMDKLVSQLRDLGAGSVLLKGGHLESEAQSTDLLILKDTVLRLSTARVATNNTHGTGCTLSSATASYLAQGESLETAVQHAKKYITEALKQADELDIGQGHGPVHHFFAGHQYV
ncbi:bifunctional hydroxymethylpyrimidine kinase/phosphomethylpyrimidine kinase [Vibrio sp. HN007]|uniref:bifunctional hydroxymethylpyrimidine kinase/phosphomethylpyrimidine kinase n=1 Tax=Vibrio iocasae TaxID=3098914 RepID=UPI0035D47C85